MTGHPDPVTAAAALDQAAHALGIARAAMLGEAGAYLFVTAGGYTSPYTAASPAGVAGGVPGWNDPLPPHIALGLIGDAAGVAGGAEPGYGDCERCLSITTMWCVPATAGDGLCDDCREAGCATQGPGNRYSCTLPAGHEGWHEAHGTSPLPVWHDGDTGYSQLRDDLPGSPLACPARWGEGEYLSRCSLPSGHEGNHADHGIEYAGHWETAEPQDPAAGMWTGNTEAIDDARNGGRARYADHAAEGAERPKECICIKFGGTGGYRIADVACPVHGLGGTQPAAVILDHDAAARLAPPAPYGHESLATWPGPAQLNDADGA